MPLFLDQGVLALVVAVGVPGLMLTLPAELKIESAY